jgi:GGDEF domain-containing protein
MANISKTIQAAINHRSISIRLEGDEFLIILEGLRTKKSLLLTQDKLALALSDSFDFEDEKIFYSTHVVALSEDKEPKNDLIAYLERLKIEMIKEKSFMNKQAS